MGRKHEQEGVLLRQPGDVNIVNAVQRAGVNEVQALMGHVRKPNHGLVWHGIVLCL